jgi:arylsulfatase A-like enzyme
MGAFMERRQFLKRTAALGAWSLVSSSCIKPMTGKRPNIVFLLTDDQRWDTLGVMGNDIIHTPNLDKLANEGTLFQQAFVTTSICCASRASIFSGQYARRHGIHDFKSRFSDQAWQQTYPGLLRRMGYYTGFIGKFGVGNEMPKDEFDFWQGIPGQPVYEQTDNQGNPKHLTEIMGEQTIEFLSSCPADQPFCLSVSFKAPHVQDRDPRQFIYDPRFKDLYKEDTIPWPETAKDKYFEQLPEFLQEPSEARRRWEIRFSTPEKYQESVKGYYRLITGVDEVLGKIRASLKDNGLDHNTVIIFSSDNGFFLGEHGLAGKWFGYEESIRVPLVIHDPRLGKDLQGQRRNEMVLNIDIAPTILDYAGIEKPREMQGESLVPLVKGYKVPWREEFFYEHLFQHPAIPPSEGIVTLYMKYLRYIDQDPVHEQLFDLRTDPLEIDNLAPRTEPETLQNWRKRCELWIENIT